VILCAAPHALRGDGIALCGCASRRRMFVAYDCKLCFGHDGWCHWKIIPTFKTERVAGKRLNCFSLSLSNHVN
jgi:hypothetical protein